MILTDFKCIECGNTFEAFLKKGKTVQCNCGSINIEKIISAPAQLITNCADKPKHRSSARFRK